METIAVMIRSILAVVLLASLASLPISLAALARGNDDDRRALRNRWGAVLCRFSPAVFVLSLIYLFGSTPLYQAIARLQVNREPSLLAATTEGPALARAQQVNSDIQTQCLNLKSRPMIKSLFPFQPIRPRTLRIIVTGLAGTALLYLLGSCLRWRPPGGDTPSDREPLGKAVASVL
jgi:hypothetical protein